MVLESLHPNTTITYLQHISAGPRLDMSWFGEIRSRFNRQDTHGSVMHDENTNKNTCRVGTISPSNYIIKIRNNQKSDTTQSKPPRKYQKTLDHYNEMHVNHLGIYQAKSKWHVLDCFVMYMWILQRKNTMAGWDMVSTQGRKSDITYERGWGI